MVFIMPYYLIEVHGDTDFYLIFLHRWHLGSWPMADPTRICKSTYVLHRPSYDFSTVLASKSERKERGGEGWRSLVRRHGRVLLECWTSEAFPCRCRVFFAFTLFRRITIYWRRANSRSSAIFHRLFSIRRTTVPFLRTSISRLPSPLSATLRAALRGLVIVRAKISSLESMRLVKPQAIWTLNSSTFQLCRFSGTAFPHLDRPCFRAGMLGWCYKSSFCFCFYNELSSRTGQKGLRKGLGE